MPGPRAVGAARARPATLAQPTRPNRERISSATLAVVSAPLLPKFFARVAPVKI
jgi:hypothetical protein